MERILCTVCQDEKCQRKNIYIESLYIIEDCVFDELIESKGITRCERHLEVFLGLPRKTEGIQLLNRHQLRCCFSFMGIRLPEIASITKESFRMILEYLKSHTRLQDTEAFSQIRAITVKKALLNSLVCAVLARKGYSGTEHLLDFEISLAVESRRKHIIVLLCGASGTGKSTLASLLGSRLGISTILSTDSIRHIIRNFVHKDEHPIMFASTYETGRLVQSAQLTEKQATIKGWNSQCECVFEYLFPVIEQFNYTRESVVIEGVHMSVPIVKRLMQNFPNCIPFIIYIKSKKKHQERFAVRSKYMTLDPSSNKYLANYGSIRAIQQKMLDKADEVLIPKVENSNIDRSLGLIHTTILRVLRKGQRGVPIYDTARRQTVLVHQEFHFLKQNIWSSQEAQELINSNINKGEVFKRFFNYEYNEPEEEHKQPPSESVSENPEIGSLASGSVGAELLHQRHDEHRERPPTAETISEDSLEAQSSSASSSESEHSIHDDTTVN